MTAPGNAAMLIDECARRHPGFRSGYTADTELRGPKSPLTALERYVLTRVAAEYVAVAPGTRIQDARSIGHLVSMLDMSRRIEPPTKLLDEISAGTSSRVSLVPLEPRHTPTLYAASMSPDQGYRWRFRGRYVSPRHFEAALAAGVLTQFGVESTLTGELLGLVVAYDHAADAEHAAIGFQRVGGLSGGQELYEALIIFIGTCFINHGLARVFFEVPEYNNWLAATEGLITKEAEIPSFFFHDGRGWAKNVYSLTSEQFWVAVRQFDS